MSLDLEAVEDMIEKISSGCSTLYEVIRKEDAEKDSEYRKRLDVIIGKLGCISLVCKNKVFEVSTEYQFESIENIVKREIHRNPTGNSYTKIEMWNGPKCNGAYPNINLCQWF